MPKPRLIVVTTLMHTALLAAGGALALELAPRLAAGQTVAALPGGEIPLATPAPDAMAGMAPNGAARRPRPLFDSHRCTALPQRMKTAWAPGAANPQRDRLVEGAVSGCPRYLSTLSLVRPHHRWRG